MSNPSETEQQNKIEFNENTKNVVKELDAFTSIIDYHEEIINEKFDVANGSNETVNVLMNYRWNIDDFSGISKNGNLPIPHCYAIEYKQLHNSSITNLINSVTAGVTSLYNAGDNIGQINKATETIGTLFTSLTSSLTSQDGESSDSIIGFKNIQKALKGTIDFTSNSLHPKNISNGIKDSKFLKPYSLLYWLETTDKKFVFPMVANPPTQSLINTYQDQNSDTSFLSANSFLSKISSYAESIVGVSKDLIDLSTLGTSSNGSFQMSAVEKAKFFQYPQQTDEYTIQFPLLNTIDKNDWLKNYRFLLLFTLRNMVFRKDNASFYPPLFYDVVIPGIIRQPFCYVSSVQVQPMGMVRQMKPPANFLTFIGETSKSTSLAIPDAWIVTIKFKSLLASSANMVLSSLFELGVESEWASGGNMGDTRDESIYNSRSTLA